MARGANAGRITIDLTAGTTQFVVDMERAKGKVVEFGAAQQRLGSTSHAAVSELQATSGALRVLEGNVTNNLRAAERFISTLPGVGAVLKAAFPIVGGLALLGVISVLVNKAEEFYDALEKLRDAPLAIASEFSKLNTGIQASNDQLRVTNDRLENEIAKLQGRPQNGLKLALDEARVSADHLFESINKNNDALKTLLKQQSIGLFKGLISNQAFTTDIEKRFVGDSGFGGFGADIAAITEKGNDALQKTTNLKERDAAQTALNTALNAKYREELAFVNSELEKARDLQKKRESTPPSEVVGPVINGVVVRSNAQPPIADQSALIAKLQGLKTNIIGQLDNVDLTNEKAGLEETKSKLEANRANAIKLKAPIDEAAIAIQKLRREIADAETESANVGKPFAQAIARGAKNGIEEITRLNEALKRAKEEANQRAVENPRLQRQANALPSQITTSQSNEIIAQTGRLAILETLKAQETSLASKQQEDAKKLLELQKQETFEIAKQLLGQDEITKREFERQKRLGDTLDKLRAQTLIINYQADATGKGRDAEREASLAGIRAKGRSDNEDPQVIAEQLAEQQAKFNLEDKQRGVGETASQGFSTFFKQFSDNTISAGREVETVLGGAFRGLDGQLTALITGQKTSFSGFFRSIAADIAQLSLNNLLGGLFKQVSSGLSGGGGIGGLIGSLFGGFKAEGGSVASGTPYVVGEKGPELFVPGGSGSIVPNRNLSGAGAQINNYIDARGSENSAEVELRIRRAQAEGARQGASAGLRAQQERRSRVPQSRAFAV